MKDRSNNDKNVIFIIIIGITTSIIIFVTTIIFRIITIIITIIQSWSLVFRLGPFLSQHLCDAKLYLWEYRSLSAFLVCTLKFVWWGCGCSFGSCVDADCLWMVSYTPCLKTPYPTNCFLGHTWTIHRHCVVIIFQGVCILKIVCVIEL